MGKVLVTGGAGFIGSHTVVELMRAGYDPVIVDNFSNSEQSAITGIESIVGEKVKVYVGDCNDQTFVSEVFEKENFSGVIHFAAYKAVGESVIKPMMYYRNNVGSLLTLLDVMKSHSVNKIVFSSSCTVYGEPDKLPVTEDSPIKPAISPYGNTKQVCEEVLRDTVTGNDQPLNAISLRYFNPIGAHPSAKIGELPMGIPNNLVPFVTQTAAGLRQSLTIFGDNYPTSDGTCIRDYIHVVDLAKAHVSALKYLENNDDEFRAFNIGTGKGNSVKEVVDTFQKVSKQKVNYNIGERRSGDVVSVYGNVDKAKKELGWKAELTLEDALRDAWRWQLGLEE